MRAEFFVAAALVAAVATGWGAYTYLEQMVETHDVVVLRTDMPAHSQLQSGDLAVEQKPVAGLHPEVVMEMNAAVGRFLQRPVTAGQALLVSDLVSLEGVPGQLAQLEPLERAVRVDADRLAGVGSQLAAGSRVDLIFVGGGHHDGVARTLLQGVEVLQIEYQETRTGEARAEAVIFRLDLPEAERLAFGLFRGDLRVVLNGYHARPAVTPGVGQADLFDAAAVDQTFPPFTDWPTSYEVSEEVPQS